MDHSHKNSKASLHYAILFILTRSPSWKDNELYKLGTFSFKSVQKGDQLLKKKGT